MYILELIAKLLKEKKSQKSSSFQRETEDEEKCEHTFFPIDSTNETLACSKCGLVIKNETLKLKPKNPFTM